jgi:hypothetical protein
MNRADALTTVSRAMTYLESQSSQVERHAEVLLVNFLIEDLKKLRTHIERTFAADPEPQ